jgi:hypothetical protein
VLARACVSNRQVRQKSLTLDGYLEGAAGLLLGDRVAGVEGDLVEALFEIGLESRAPGRLRAHVTKPVEIRRGLLVRHEGLVPPWW